MIVVKAGDRLSEIPAKGLKLSRLVSYAAERKFKFGMFKIFWVKEDSSRVLISNQDALTQALEGPLPREILISSAEDGQNEVKTVSLFERLRNQAKTSNVRGSLEGDSKDDFPGEEVAKSTTTQLPVETEKFEACKNPRAISAETVIPLQDISLSQVWPKQGYIEAPFTDSRTLQACETVAFQSPRYDNSSLAELPFEERNPTKGLFNTQIFSPTSEISLCYTPGWESPTNLKKTDAASHLQMQDASKAHFSLVSDRQSPLEVRVQETHSKPTPIKRQKRCCALL